MQKHGQVYRHTCHLWITVVFQLSKRLKQSALIVKSRMKSAVDEKGWGQPPADVRPGFCLLLSFLQCSDTVSLVTEQTFGPWQTCITYPQRLSFGTHLKKTKGKQTPRFTWKMTIKIEVKVCFFIIWHFSLSVALKKISSAKNHPAKMPDSHLFSLSKVAGNTVLLCSTSNAIKFGFVLLLQLLQSFYTLNFYSINYINSLKSQFMTLLWITDIRSQLSNNKYNVLTTHTYVMHDTYLPAKVNKRCPTFTTSDVQLVSDWTDNSLMLGAADESLTLGWYSNSSVVSRDAISLVMGRAINSPVSDRDANSSTSRIASMPPRTEICDWAGSRSNGWNSSHVKRQSDGGLSNSQLAPKLADDFGPICR